MVHKNLKRHVVGENLLHSRSHHVVAAVVRDARIQFGEQKALCTLVLVAHDVAGTGNLDSMIMSASSMGALRRFAKEAYSGWFW